MIRRPPRSTRTDTLLPYTTLFRSLGIGCLRGGALPVAGTAVATPARAFRDSVLAEVLNPKTALFHFAFLPKFTDPAAAFPVWLQIAVLGIVVNALFSVTDAVLIEASHAAAARLRASDGMLRTLRRLGTRKSVVSGKRLSGPVEPGG